jgi:hypothetical protein
MKRAKGRKRRNVRYGLHPQSALVLFRGDRFVTILQFPFSIIFVIPGSIRKYDVIILPDLNPCSISKFSRFRVFGDFVIITHRLNPSFFSFSLPILIVPRQIRRGRWVRSFCTYDEGEKALFLLTLYSIVSYLRSGSRGTISPLLESEGRSRCVACHTSRTLTYHVPFWNWPTCPTSTQPQSSPTLIL